MRMRIDVMRRRGVSAEREAGWYHTDLFAPPAGLPLVHLRF
jgi:hypothetical protein